TRPTQCCRSLQAGMPMRIIAQLQQRLDTALAELVPDAAARKRYVDMVKPATDAKHGDYQANCAMSLAKVVGRSPRDVAAEIVKRLPTGDMLEPPQIAGPGFINL